MTLFISFCIIYNMKKRIKLKDRILPNYTRGEEIANMVTHIVGGAIGVCALVLCVIFAAIRGNVYGIISGSIFGVSMITLYTFSSIYHGLNPKLTAKKVFQILDHCTIFILIAGTYTPILLGPTREYNSFLGWGLFGVVWFLAILGVVLNSIDLEKYKKFSMICYLFMGWCIMVIAPKIKYILCKEAFMMILIGGIVYTIGAVLYAIGNKKKYFHTYFHVFVDIGSLLHFLAILLYIV